MCLPVAPTLPARCWRSSRLAWCKTEPWDTKTCALSANTSSSSPETSSARTHRRTSRHWLSPSPSSTSLISHTVGLLRFKHLNELSQGPQQGVLEGDFALCISLYHGYELLMQMGLRSLFFYIQGIMDGSRGESPPLPSACRTRGVHRSPSPPSRPGVARSCVMSVFHLVSRDVPGSKRAAEDSRLNGPLPRDGSDVCQAICWYSCPFFSHKQPFSGLQLTEEFLWIFGYRLCPIKN